MTGNNNGASAPNRVLARTGIPRAAPEDCIKAMSAPQRRHILRTLHSVGDARSPMELAKAFGLPINRISYHVRVLRECGALGLTDTLQRRGATEHFYASTVNDNELVMKLLEATRVEDGDAFGA
jgi:DNA-binding transcriptional ArsR family regulator